jgi:hypothetical protein
MMLAPSGDEAKRAMAEIVCVSRLHFLFAADSAWTVEHVMSLLGWSDEARARRNWSVFAPFGRWSEGMLREGLFDLYLATVDHLHDLDDTLVRAVFGHLAGIALRSERDPLDWLPRVVAALATGIRPNLVDAITRVMRQLPQEAVEHEWQRWISTYWSNRLRSVPTRLSVDETSAMTGWVPLLQQSFVSGVDLVVKSPARLDDHADILRDLDRHIADSPADCAKLLAHLLKYTQEPFWGGHQLIPLLTRLRRSGAADVPAAFEQAARLGMTIPDE